MAGIGRVRQSARAGFDAAYRRLFGDVGLKEFHEFRYWRMRSRTEDGDLSNSWYKRYYTDYFGIPIEFYDGKRVLDVGCGPRGSLEWADRAAERVGLDPLIGKYKNLGIDRHSMDYVEAYSEAIPFEDGHFDVVMSMNSLDHVVDVGETVSEIVRVTRPGGTILLLTNIDREPTACEPNVFGLEVLDLFRGCSVEQQRRLESPELRNSWTIPFDETDPDPRPSGLAAQLRRG